MKKIKRLVTSVSTLFLLPVVAFAQGGQFDPDGGEFGEFLTNILTFIGDVLIPFILGIGFLLFVWGMFLYFIAGGADEEKRGKGKSLIIWATLGFVIIIVFWGVINIIAGGTGLGGESLNEDLLPRAIPE
jgi:hypothetical protein